jgi:non-ribosomal peptide synthetase component F
MMPSVEITPFDSVPDATLDATLPWPPPTLLEQLDARREKQDPLLALWQETNRRRAQELALVHGRERYSFAQLEKGAQQLAQALLQRGVLPGDVLAVQGTRGVGTVVAQLAALKLACCYAPIDPLWPRAMQLARLQHSQASALLYCDAESIGHALPHSRIVNVLDDKVQNTAGIALPAATDIPVQQPLYLLYTSGSSGEPKGVLGTRLGLWQRVRWQWQQLPYRAGERQAQRTRLSFVDAVAEQWSALLAGVPLVIIDDQNVQDLHQLVEQVAEQNVTRLVLVPAMLQHLLDGDFKLAQRWQALRVCHCSGAVMPKALWQRAQDTLPQCCWVNLYGMTEAAADACAYWTPSPATATEVQRLAACETIPIGNALLGQRWLVSDSVDQEGGQNGDQGSDQGGNQKRQAHALFLAGDGLALGYHGNPRATAECFVPAIDQDHSNGRAGARMYATGDWVFHHATEEAGDLGLEFAGRRDQQVKVRGQRVELLAVEQCALRHPAVQECVALIVSKWDVLCLVLAPVTGAEITAATLRTFLHEHLAATMTPDLIDIRESLPHLWNGKLDRQTIACSLTRVEMDGTPPITATEQRLALLWREVLRCPPPLRESRFLALGGNSLKAALLLARLREAWALPIAVSDFFGLHTLAAQAEYLDRCARQAQVAAMASQWLPPTAETAVDDVDGYDVVDF